MPGSYQDLSQAFGDLALDPMFQAGIATLGQTGSAGEMVSRGWQQGMQAVTANRLARQRELYRQTQVAQAKAQMAAAQRAEQAAQAQRAAQQQYIGGLPQDQQALAGAFPQQYAEGQIAEQFRDPNRNPVRYGTTPHYAVGPDGQVTAVQLSNAGGAQPIGLPSGFNLMKPGMKYDFGDSIGTVDPITGQLRSVMKKNLAPAQEPEYLGEAEATKVTARTEAEKAVQTIADYDDVEANFEQQIQQLRELARHPGLEASTGYRSMLYTLPASEAADFEARLDQVKGGVYATAYETLKGGGAITEFEAKTVADGYQRLQRVDVKSSDYRKAIADFEELLRTQMASGLRKLRKAQAKRAGLSALPVAPEAVPAPVPAGVPTDAGMMQDAQAMQPVDVEGSFDETYRRLNERLERLGIPSGVE